jgi:hypothetical protein
MKGLLAMENIIIPNRFLPLSNWPMVYFYTLSDPITKEICYVGQTSDPHTRFYQHCRTGKGHYDGNAQKTLWLFYLSAVHDALPIMTIVDCMIDNGSVQKREYEIIEKMRNEGHPLLNIKPKIGRRFREEYWERMQNAEFKKHRMVYEDKCRRKKILRDMGDTQ